MNLTAKQAKRAVSFQFTSKSEFSVSLEVGAQQCGFVRTFMFAGAACLADGTKLTRATTTTKTTGAPTKFIVADGCTKDWRNLAPKCMAGGPGATGKAAVRCCNKDKCASKS